MTTKIQEHSMSIQGHSPEQPPVGLMKVDYSLHKQPQPYTSIKVGVSLPVFIEHGEDWADKLEEAMRQVKARVQAEVDEEYEQGYGEPPPYSNETRGYYLVCEDEKLVALCPTGQEQEGCWRDFIPQGEGHRLNYLRDKIEVEYPHYGVIDLELEEPLPDLESFQWWRLQDDSLLIFLEQDQDFTYRNEWGRWFCHGQHIGFLETALEAAQVDAAKRGATLFDCRDVDFSRLPAPSEKVEGDGINEDEISF